MEVTKVKRLDIVHKGNCHDGYPTIVLIDGKTGPEMDPPRWDKVITLVAEAGEPLRVEVDYANGFPSQAYEPEEFELHLGDLTVKCPYPGRYPALVMLGGYNPRVRSLTILFQEGEAVWTNLTILPYMPTDESVDQPEVR